MNDAEAYDYRNVKKIFEIVYKAKRYQDVLGNKKLKKFQKQIDKEINYWKNNFRKWRVQSLL